ncbi:MAG: hypothetical protein U1F46_00360 [Marinagarivorans sp.]
MGGVHFSQVIVSVMALACFAGCASQATQEDTEEIAFVGAGDQPSSKNYTIAVKAMSQTELKTCGQLALAAHNDLSTLKFETRGLSDDRQAIKNAQIQIDTDRTTIDARNNAKIAAFNQRIKALHESISAFNQRMESHNSNVTTANRKVAQFNISCADRPYRVSDLIVLTEDEQNALAIYAKPFELPVYTQGPFPEDESYLIKY